MTVAHYVLLYCYMSVFPIHYSYLTFPPTAFPLSSFLFPPNPLFPSHLQSPAIFQHSSGPPHRVPLCQWVREGAHSPTSHHVLPLDSPQETTNYCTAFPRTHLASFCLHFLPRSITLLLLQFHHSSPFLPLTLLRFWKSATINRLHPLFFKTSVYTQTALLKKTIDQTLRFQRKGASRP